MPRSVIRTQFQTYSGASEPGASEAPGCNFARISAASGKRPSSRLEKTSHPSATTSNTPPLPSFRVTWAPSPASSAASRLEAWGR